MLQKIKDLVLGFLKLAWDKIKAFLKKWWMHIVNYIIVCFLYGRIWTIESSLDIKGLLILTLGGLYILFLTSYLVYKISGLEKFFKRDEEEGISF